MAEPGLIHNVEAEGPGTHVLILGVGTYRHLLDGTEPREELADGMGQVASPPRSARALAEWFLTRFRNPERPLASLAMAVSAAEGETPLWPDGGNQPAAALPQADLAGVVSLVETWAARAASHPDNLAIFYFSGHGVSAGEPLLLCHDYGARQQNRFAHAINFGHFRAAMESREPRHQVFVIDACRSPAALRNRIMGAAVSLGDALLEPADGGPARQSIHFATSSLSPTYARRDGLSFYTDALIDALDGGGAQPDLGYWVGTNGLQTALAAYTARAAEQNDVEQEPDRIRSQLFPIHKPEQIRIPLHVRCEPVEAWAQAMTLAATSDEVREEYAHDPASAPDCREWSARLPPDKYKVVAAFAAGCFAPAENSVMLVPPSTPCVLQVRPRA